MVKTTPAPFLEAAIHIVADLSRSMEEAERYRRLLEALALLLPCDAIALLRLERGALAPLSTIGFSDDILGRRFPVDKHPRFAKILGSPEPTRFPADSPLPDPYDGIVGMQWNKQHVHDCMGCPVIVHGRIWGVLTLDSMVAGQFDESSEQRLKSFASLAAAAVVVAEHIEQLHEKVALFQRAEDRSARAEMIGTSAQHRALLEEIATVASSDLTVLISGPTGVGKELVAEALHRQSTRHDRPMIRVNCAALPEALVESELFGHIRGAFSGALESRSGKFEVADKATLFLDEVGELPLAVQPKLLRVLQSGQLQRLGSDREHHVDVRVIAATNRDLADEVRKGRFRADLYHRLSVYPLRIPPLEERVDDILPLAGYFLQRSRGRFGLRGVRLSEDAVAALRAYNWPGNVRELEHVLSRAALRAYRARSAEEDILTIDARALALDSSADLSTAARSATADSNHTDMERVRETRSESFGGTRAFYSPSTTAGPLRDAVDGFQRALITASLARHEGVWSKVAQELELDRANLHRLARRLGLK